jgi:isocitrate dehydrogenase
VREFCDYFVICTGIIRAYWNSFQRIAREFREARAGESGVTNPTAAIWAGAMMLEHLGANDAAQFVMNASERAL